MKDVVKAETARFIEALKKETNSDITKINREKLKAIGLEYSTPKELLEPLLELTETVVKASLLLGYFHAMPEKTKKDFADDGDFSISDSFDIPFEEAVQFLKSKVPMRKAEWSALEPKLKFRAFTVAKLSEADHINALKKRLANYVENGEGVVKSWGDIKNLTEEFGKQFSPRYWETVYRTNVQSAYNAGRLMQYKNNEPPAWELLITEDGRTSDICHNIARLVGNGKALPSSHNFWSSYGFPPYHFNCRTTFRAVYDYEIGKGVQVEDVPMEKISSHFKPKKGFGGNPIEKESWWKITDSMKKRIDKYGLKEEVEKAAKEAGIDNYDVRLANEKITKHKHEETGFVANAIKGAEPKQKEIAIAKTLHENGYEVLFTPENSFIKGIKNPEGVIPKLNKIIEMKEIDSEDIGKIGDKIKESVKQQTEIVVLNFDNKTNYTKQQAIEAARETIHKTIPNDIATTNQTKLTEKQKKSFEEKKKGIQKLKEVWVIWNGKISKIKK